MLFSNIVNTNLTSVITKNSNDIESYKPYTLKMMSENYGTHPRTEVLTMNDLKVEPSMLDTKNQVDNLNSYRVYFLQSQLISSDQGQQTLNNTGSLHNANKEQKQQNQCPFEKSPSKGGENNNIMIIQNDIKNILDNNNKETPQLKHLQMNSKDHIGKSVVIY